MDYYWLLTYGSRDDLKHIYIAPGSVEGVQHKWNRGEPIHTPHGSVPARDIRSFEPSDRPYGEQRLLQEAAQAFKEPIIHTTEVKGTIYESVNAKWVKQVVTQSKWERYYNAIDAYHKLDDDGVRVTMAFLVPTHLINEMRTPLCTNKEIDLLTIRS